MSRGNPPRIAARLGGRELPAGPLLDEVAALERSAYLQRRAVLAPQVPRAQRVIMTERAWQDQIIRVAKALGFYVYHPHLSKWSERGWPNLSLLHEGRGRALWVECKADDGHLTEAQVAVFDRMLRCGLEVHCWRPSMGLERVAEVLQHGR